MVAAVLAGCGEDKGGEDKTPQAQPEATASEPAPEVSLPPGAQPGLDDYNGDGTPDPTCTTQDFGGDLMVFGSPRLVHVLAQLELVDEYLIYLNPVTLGGGTPLFGPGHGTRLTLLEFKTFGAGVTMLRYATAGEQP